MIFVYTGQPGHGKTLSAMLRALEFKDEGRLVYACNVRGLSQEKSGFNIITPQQFIEWETTTPEGAVILVDECYQQNMLPKRPPSSSVPDHVRQLAVHRHTGRDFIFVCQSPARQMDDFVHDLVEEHVHVRRFFGTILQKLKIFDYFERNAVKAKGTKTRWRFLPKRVFGMYESTVLDTTDGSIPWYYYAALLLLIALPYGIYYNFKSVNETFSGKEKAALTGENGAIAKVEQGKSAPVETQKKKVDTLEEYVDQFTPRIPSQPWSAPIYDELDPPNNPPRVFCMSSGNPVNDCGCITDQGTTYEMAYPTCVIVARHGQYEPYLDVVQNNQKSADAAQQLAYMQENKLREKQIQPVPRELIGSQVEPSQVGQPAKNVRGWIRNY